MIIVISAQAWKFLPYLRFADIVANVPRKNRLDFLFDSVNVEISQDFRHLSSYQVYVSFARFVLLTILRHIPRDPSQIQTRPYLFRGETRSNRDGNSHSLNGTSKNSACRNGNGCLL